MVAYRNQRGSRGAGGERSPLFLAISLAWAHIAATFAGCGTEMPRSCTGWMPGRSPGCSFYVLHVDRDTDLGLTATSGCTIAVGGDVCR